MKAGKPKAITPRQFGDAMHTLGCCLEQADYEALIGLAWCLIPLDRRRAGVLAAVFSVKEARRLNAIRAARQGRGAGN